jgi:hypothetical protein
VEDMAVSALLLEKGWEGRTIDGWMDGWDVGYHIKTSRR